MTERDIGWIQIFAENGQEALELHIWAFRLAEDRRVSLPTIVNFDGFILSHTIEPIVMPTQEQVQNFLPPYNPLQRLDIDNPISMGPVGIPDIYTEARKVQHQVLVDAYNPIVETLNELGEHFGNHYKLVETYKAKDAEVLLLTMGSVSETAMTAVDKCRRDGKKVGLIRLRLWRPFPFKDLFEAVGSVPVLGVMDRHLSTGGPLGPVASEVKSAFYNQEQKPQVVEFIGGLGGRDISIDDFCNIFDDILKAAETGVVPPATIIGLRE
jgi:pyruvate ferredoxin oxidoreductase alpha subunit